MQTLAILPIKSFSRAKRRLGPEYGAGSRSALARAMFGDVLAALRRCEEIDAIVVVTGEKKAIELAQSQGVAIVHEEEEEGQSSAVAPAIARAKSHGFERVMLIPGDCPLASPSEIDDLLKRCETTQAAATIVPDRHEIGTNALVLVPPGAIEPQFGEDSLRRHAEQAKQLGLESRIERIDSLALDIDSPEDLAELEERLKTWHGGAASTRGVIQQLQRLHQATAPTV